MQENTASPITERTPEEKHVESLSSIAPQSEIRPSISSAEPERDTLLDPPRTSVGARVLAFLAHLGSILIWPFTAMLQAVSWALSPPPLTDALPAPPPWPAKNAALSTEQQGEAMLYSLFVLPPRYLQGIAKLADFLADVQTRSQSERLRTQVHFIVSRFDARTKEPVPVAWVRALLPHEVRSDVTRALEELEDENAIELVPLKTRDESILKGAICNELGSPLTHAKVLRRL